MIVTKSISAENTYSDWTIFNKGTVDLELTGTFVADVIVERRCKNEGGTYGATTSQTFIGTGQFILECSQKLPEYRVGVATGKFTSGTVVARLAQG